MEHEELEEQVELTGKTPPEETAGEETPGVQTPSEETSAQQPVEVDRRREVETFLDTFPGVEMGDIPQEVWARAAGGLGLTGAWALYENGLLRQRLAALEQNGENRARSLGSLGSRQSMSGGGSIEAYWEEAGS